MKNVSSSIWLYASCDNDGNIKSLMAGTLDDLRHHAKGILLDILGDDGDCPDEDAETALRSGIAELDELTNTGTGSWLIKLADFDALAAYGTMMIERSSFKL